MRSGLAIVAALPREVAGLVKGVKPDAALKARGVWLYRLPCAVVVAAGMGQERVALAVAAALEEVPGAVLISAGLAGSCAPGVLPGAVLECGLVVDVRTGERFGGTGDSPVLVSTDAIASVAEKQRLAVAYGASVVDMEAATVARLALGRGVEFRAIKAVSDGCDFELQGLSRFSGPRGEFRTVAFAVHTALRPWLWGRAMTLGRHSGAALEALRVALQAVLDSQ